MSTIVSYEVYSFRTGSWYIDSIYDDKEQALHEARLLIGGRHQRGVKVIKENYNEDTGEAMDVVIFNEQSGDKKPAMMPIKKSTAIAGAPPRKKPEPVESLTAYIVKMVLLIGAIGLGLIALLSLAKHYIG